MRHEDVIKRPLILTEKGSALREAENQYLFEVDPRANKVEIKQAVESLFKVNVKRVRTMVVRGRIKRLGRSYHKTRNWKKAVVTLAEGDQIDFFEGA
jgi:large subunit ribosomal protein L23